MEVTNSNKTRGDSNTNTRGRNTSKKNSLNDTKRAKTKGVKKTKPDEEGRKPEKKQEKKKQGFDLRGWSGGLRAVTVTEKKKKKGDNFRVVESGTGDGCFMGPGKWSRKL